MIPLPITAARTLDVDGHTWLELTVDGVAWAFEAPKATMLQHGLLLLPLELSRYGETHAIYSAAEDQESPIENTTADPVAVELGRRLWVGELPLGEPVQIPPLLEAEAARWEINPTAGIFRRKI